MPVWFALITQEPTCSKVTTPLVIEQTPLEPASTAKVTACPEAPPVAAGVYVPLTTGETGVEVNVMLCVAIGYATVTDPLPAAVPLARLPPLPALAEYVVVVPPPDGPLELPAPAPLPNAPEPPPP